MRYSDRVYTDRWSDSVIDDYARDEGLRSITNCDENEGCIHTFGDKQLSIDGRKLQMENKTPLKLYLKNENNGKFEYTGKRFIITDIEIGGIDGFDNNFNKFICELKRIPDNDIKGISRNTNNMESHAITIQKLFRGRHSRINTVFRIIKDNPIEWNNLIKLYNIFGESLNENDMKFMKGKLYEIFFSQKSKLFKHVDLEGYDILFMGIKIEIKFRQQMLLTSGRNLKKNIEFRIKNSNGSRTIKLNRGNTADIYILIQRDAIAYVMGYNVLKCLHGVGDLDAKIPKNVIDLIWKLDTNITISNGVFNLSNLITDIYKCICNSIWENKDWKENLKICLHNIADNL